MNPISRRSSTMTRSWRIAAAVALALAGALGCSNPSETLGPDNHVDVTNLVGHFELTADNIQNVTTRMTYTWQNPGIYAAIQHRSFMPHGTTLLIIKDADGTEVYNGKLLYELDDRTLNGTPGEWTVIFSLDKSVGQIDVILDGAYPPD
jgi:hypothetical protein